MTARRPAALISPPAIRQLCAGHPPCSAIDQTGEQMFYLVLSPSGGSPRMSRLPLPAPRAMLPAEEATMYAINRDTLPRAY